VPLATVIDVEPFGHRAAPGTGTAFLVPGAFVARCVVDYA
jgi:hypothetical protein